MTTPVEYTFYRYWRSIVIKIPNILFRSARIGLFIPIFILFLIALLNKQIAEQFNAAWRGVSPWYSAIIIGILLLYGIMCAIYERDRELYGAYKAVKEELSQLRKEVLEDSIYISLNEATRLLYEELEETDKGRYFIERNIKPTSLGTKRKNETEQDAILRYLGTFIVFEKIEIYGKQPPSTMLRKIDQEIFKRIFLLKNGATSLWFSEKGEPEYTDLSIKKEDMRKAFDKIKENIGIH
jgi:hypothetical protein